MKTAETPKKPRRHEITSPLMEADSYSELKTALIRYLEKTGKSGRSKSRRSFIRELSVWNELAKYFPEWSEKTGTEDFDGDPENDFDTDRPIEKFDKGYPIRVKTLDDWLKGQREPDGSYRIIEPNYPRAMAIGRYLQSIDALQKNWPKQGNFENIFDQLSAFLTRYELVKFPNLPESITVFSHEKLEVEEYTVVELSFQKNGSGIKIHLSEKSFIPIFNETIDGFVGRILKKQSNATKNLNGVGKFVSEDVVQLINLNKSGLRHNVRVGFLSNLITNSDIVRSFQFGEIFNMYNASIKSNGSGKHGININSFVHSDDRYKNLRHSNIRNQLDAAKDFQKRLKKNLSNESLKHDILENNNKSLFSQLKLGGSLRLKSNLYDAIDKGDARLMIEALQDVADVNKNFENLPINPLILAASVNAVYCAKVLINDYNADPLQRDNSGRLPSMCADDTELIKYLLSVERQSAEARGIDYDKFVLAPLIEVKNTPFPDPAV